MPRSTKRFLPLLVFLALACNTLLPPVRLSVTAPPSARLSVTAPVVEAPTAAPRPTEPATPEPGFGLRPGDITFHPGPQLYSGDRVSLTIDAANADPAWSDAYVRVYSAGAPPALLGTERFASFGIGGRAQATFWWLWDTAGLVGPQTLTVTVESAAGGPPLDALTVTAELRPAEQRPMPEPLAQWAQAESDCCLFHYLTGTAAARDIDQIRVEADRAFERVETVLGVRRPERVTFTLLSRLLGHGGFASAEISVTYIDRNPAGLDLPTLFAHEGTHIVDRQIAAARPTLITEGLAVYVAGGHYKPEDLDRRAAALLRLDRYLPLTPLAKDFYRSQHEIGYLEAGALVKYLVDQYGWPRFRGMLASFEPAANDAEMLDAGLLAHYGKSLTALEEEWLTHLRRFPAESAQTDDLRLTIRLFDLLRRYQQAHDPEAYFLTAWLPDGPAARERGVVADFVRGPRAAENIALEAMLVAAQQALVAGDYAAAETLLQSVDAVLAAGLRFDDPLAARYWQTVTQLAAQGYEVQTLDFTPAGPRVTAILNWPRLETVTYNTGQ